MTDHEAETQLDYEPVDPTPTEPSDSFAWSDEDQDSDDAPTEVLGGRKAPLVGLVAVLLAAVIGLAALAWLDTGDRGSQDVAPPATTTTVTVTPTTVAPGPDKATTRPILPLGKKVLDYCPEDLGVDCDIEWRVTAIETDVPMCQKPSLILGSGQMTLRFTVEIKVADRLRIVSDPTRLNDIFHPIMWGVRTADGEIYRTVTEVGCSDQMDGVRLTPGEKTTKVFTIAVPKSTTELHSYISDELDGGAWLVPEKTSA